jgi:hypothetical protein
VWVIPGEEWTRDGPGTWGWGESLTRLDMDWMNDGEDERELEGALMEYEVNGLCM